MCLAGPRRLDRKAARNLICGECEKLAPYRLIDRTTFGIVFVGMFPHASMRNITPHTTLLPISLNGLRQFRTPAAHRRFFADGSNASVEIARAYIRSAGVGYSRGCSSRSSLDVFDLEVWVLLGAVSQIKISCFSCRFFYLEGKWYVRRQSEDPYKVGQGR